MAADVGGQIAGTVQAAFAGDVTIENLDRPQVERPRRELPPERGPQSDEGHPSRRGVSSRPVIDKAPEVGRQSMWERGKLPEGGRMRSRDPGGNRAVGMSVPPETVAYSNVLPCQVGDDVH